MADDFLAAFSEVNVDEEEAAPESTEQQLKNSLLGETWNYAECIKAIRGEQLPKRGLGLAVTRQCVVRGIRHHDGFGTELRGLDPLFTRALNARMIMSNRIPDMQSPEEYPYCIWHPDLASEATYRQLVETYPAMRYHVGRACAVSGYTNLYRELALLPEVHIAEEARENKATGADILEDIMLQPIQFKVMDDYSRSVVAEERSRPRAQMNGDTCVQEFLRVTHKPSNSSTGLKRYFDITEDMGVDESDSDEQYTYSLGGIHLYAALPPDPVRTTLLYSPLPFHLPTLQKDLLILMAAYNGDIDRYARLRRPIPISSMERNCLVHGIYHHTFFARWCSANLFSPGIASPNVMMHLKSAATARAIMNNNLSQIDSSSLPYTVWYPNVAAPSTYELLVQLEPSMLVSAARACIVGDYQETFDRLEPPPAWDLLVEARASRNPHYVEYLERRARDHPALVTEESISEEWKRWTVRDASLNNSTQFVRNPSTQDVGISFEGVYNGLMCGVERVEGVCIPADWVGQHGDDSRTMGNIYEDKLRS